MYYFRSKGVWKSFYILCNLQQLTSDVSELSAFLLRTTHWVLEMCIYAVFY